MSKIPPEELGSLGETKFEELCKRSRLKVSTPRPDLTGKDFLVEFDFVECDEFMSLDTRPAPLACYVQVKTIWTPKRRAVLTLSSAQRLAWETKPAFVCIVRLDTRLDVEDIYLVHVIDEPLAKLLKRLREEDAKGTRQLNRKHICYSIHEGDRIESAGGNLYWREPSEVTWRATL